MTQGQEELSVKYQRGTTENTAFLDEETNDLLNFGKRFPYKDGGSTWLDENGNPDLSHGVETWITSRMAHVYSLGVLYGHPGSEELVDAALKGLTGILHDDEHGGWYPQVFTDGTHAPGKVCYAHAFVILAATSAVYVDRPGAKELLDLALRTYDEHFWDDKLGLAVDTWNTEFTELDPYRGLNANMHTTEAFLAVADVTGDNSYRVRAGRIIDHVLGWARNNGWRIPEHFNSGWEPQLEFNADKKDDQFKPYGATPGHGIEWARLITQWALSTYPDDEAARKPYVEAAEQLFRRAVADGWDADGQPGIVYTTDWEGRPVVHDRMHWTIAEAVNTSATLAKVTGDPFYDEYYARFCKYIDECVVDHVKGSWFHQLDRDNHVIGTVWPGKSDLYHATQSTLIPRLDPALSVVPALGEAKKAGKAF
ncbi:N-acyl-D-glucosamine 2-epimerase [Bifidobacterium sp. UTCIF-37]|uniref:AGE family epimerase/isomerase n=1 Tax=unclassified Bifidobacterium TaxID=2608897 RepID=UPI00112BB6BD|nr:MULTISPECIES: AGE family epimerase/isomerase [unclassified Bifidobacterium]TPF86481.1 N-acyl-D-glucosamine 2-epimerase [Bifidobacterium sp. UTCIF-37]TPF89431.1 N-acyl-D-glucosamine 2-epimerase [Bifidobacterium sp. UTCIF-38]